MVPATKYLILCSCIAVAGCSSIPGVPIDRDLPITEILQHTTCELRRAFLALNASKYKSFGAQEWLIGVTLTPKTDRDRVAGIGATGKSTVDPKIAYFTNWALGSVGSPGAQVESKGSSNATINYTIHSRDLLDEKKFPINCDNMRPESNALSEHLGIREWFSRAITAQDDVFGKLAKFDKPTFSAEILIKYSGNGNFTYNFPIASTTFASTSAFENEDELLSIALTPDPLPKIFHVQTLPSGGLFGVRPPDKVSTGSKLDPQSRLDEIQLQQAIVNKLNSLQQ